MLRSNISMLIDVAKNLEWLLDEIVFVGGAITELMLTDKVKLGVRPTKDVDVIVELASQIKYAELEHIIRKRGFSPRADDGDPICRWIIGETVVDLMPVNTEVLGFSNRWYPQAIENWFHVPLTDKLTIRVITAPYFLATKLEAFIGRGQGDFLVSHDIEDIIMVLNGRAELIEEIKVASSDIKTYLAEHFSRYVTDQDFSEAIQWSLPGDDASQSRFALILKRMQEIINLADN